MSKTNLIYNVEGKPSWGKTFIFALQQLLAILAATIAVPAIVGNGMSQSAALFGAGAGTLVYLLLTKFKSPVFLGSSFAFIGSMTAAFGGAAATCTGLGYFGLLIGAGFAGLVYVILALIVKVAGTKWIDKVMPAVVIGPVVAIIGLSLAGNAIGDLTKGSYTVSNVPTADMWVALSCGLVTLFTTIAVSVYCKKMLKMIPFIIGICAGYLLASIFTGFGWLFDNNSLKVIDFEAFANITEWVPNFTFTKIAPAFDLEAGEIMGHIGTVAVAYIPVAFVVFAEHIADHKNLSTIIDRDLLKEPGLHRTLLGDGLGSIAGAMFGGCPNTTYGESVGTIAISGNASIRTILVTALLAILLSFIAPFTTFLASIPKCVMGGICIALYGFIAVSGLKMLQKVDLGDNRNLFVVATILIAGIGGFTLTIKFTEDFVITITSVACALILGILVNLFVNIKKAPAEK